MLDFTRIATVSPSLRVWDCGYNASQMKPLVTKARLAGAHVVLFPELGITGYSCADLFRQPVLLRAAEAAVADLLAWTADWDGVMVFGCPVPVGGNLFNCALVAQSGKLMGIVPKTHLPGNNEFYEPRWFTPGADAVPGTQCFADRKPLSVRICFFRSRDIRTW
jgi:NAD+ synthase (glutamine-hydrolysing)